ncbi:MAG: hypothetical protein IIC76_02410 [Bacteroidetes bacterium]|nr:hypothetical protein [Bacteroidota bacterium]
MKIIKKIIIFLALFFSTVFGFGGRPPPPPPFISGRAEGNLHIPPLFLSESDTNKVTILAGLSYFTASSIDGNIKVEGTNTIQTGKNNLHWNIPQTNLNLGIDLKAWRNFSFFTEFRISQIKNEIAVSGFNFGLGMFVNIKGNYNVRFDLGLNYESMNFDSFWQENDSTLQNRSIDDGYVNPFISLTINTSFKEWIINPFVQFSYSNQTLFSKKMVGFKPDEVYSDIELFIITPGITYRMNKTILIIIGAAAYQIPSGIENLSNETTLSAFVQINFLL